MPGLSPASLMLMAPGSHLLGKSGYAIRSCVLDRNACVCAGETDHKHWSAQFTHSFDKILYNTKAMHSNVASNVNKAGFGC